MSETPKNSDPLPLLIAIVAVVIAWAVVQIVAMLVSLLLMVLIAAALYYGANLGYKLAMDSEVWESRRINKYKKFQDSREKEKEYFQSQGQDWMNDIVDNHYDDEQRNLYKKKDKLQDVGKTVKKVKDLFK